MDPAPSGKRTPQKGPIKAAVPKKMGTTVGSHVSLREDTPFEIVVGVIILPSSEAQGSKDP